MGRIETAAKPYRFTIGQQVVLSATRLERLPVVGSFRIIARLPAELGEHQYRVKHDREAFERRVGEYRLTAAA